MRNLFNRSRAQPARAAERQDFSDVTTSARAQDLHSHGELARVLLVPVALGGIDADTNAAYVPPEVCEVQQRLTETLKRYMSEGRIDNLSVAPEYKGRSLVPAKIRVSARHSGRVGEFTTVIGIW